MRRAEDRLEQVVDELLQRALRRQQSRQVDLRHHLVVTLAVFIVVPLVPHQMPDLKAVVVVVVEGRGCATERRAVTSACHLRKVERLVLVIQVSVGLVWHGGDVIHARLLRDESQEGSVGNAVVVDSVHLLPVALRLGRRVLIVQNQPTGCSCSPFKVEVFLLWPLAVGESAVDGVERFFFHLKCLSLD